MRISKETKIDSMSRIKLSLLFFLFISKNTIIDISIKLFFKKNKSPKKILIFRIGSIGDGICAIPAIMNIKANFPNSHIDLLTSTGKVKGLVSLENLLSSQYYDSIINYDDKSWFDLTNTLISNQYNLVIHLTQQGTGLFKSLRDIFYFKFIIRVKSAFGWGVSTINVFKKTQNKFVVFENERTRLNKILVRQYGLTLFSNNKFSFPITQNDESFIEKLYLTTIKEKKFSNIAIVIGAKRSSNRWPILYFREVIKEFSSNYNIIIIGGKEDNLLANSIIDLPNTYSFCGKTTPLQSGLVLQKCLLTISNDTGPMHLSYAFGTPVVAIFSNRDFPYLWYPPNDNYNFVHRSKNIKCAICLSEVCFNNNLCMTNIKPKEIIDSVYNLLKSLP
jgi:heptosyltransferase-3